MKNLLLIFIRRNKNKVEFIPLAKQTVLDYVQTHLDVTDDIYIVWFCKTLQNWKALISTTLPDGMYYEVTYNGDKKEIYLDAYKKFENKHIKVQ